jgi:membrane protease subunit HflK
MRRALILVLLGLAGVAGYLSTGVRVIAPGEVAVVRRMGRMLPAPWTAGLHVGWPAGFDRITRVRIDEVRRLEIGLDRVPGPADDPGAGEFLTGDLNLVRARAVVQYRVADPAAFVLRARDREALIPRLAEASLSSAIARHKIDAALRESRAQVAVDTQRELEHRAKAYGLGLAILGVSLTDARPPVEVQPDFAAAQAAQAERDRRITEARTYAGTARHAAGAAARGKLDRARAQADREVALVQSRAGRFLAILGESEKSRALTVSRLYLEAMRDLLPRVQRKIVVSPEEPVDLTIFGADK